MPKETYNKPSDVVASDGRVLVDGPGGVNLAFTPSAAQVTGGRLIEEAAKAEAQAGGEEAADESADANSAPGGTDDEPA